MFRKCFDRRALSPVIASLIMASVVIALSFTVLAWAQFRTSDYAETYGETTDAEIARLKERLTVEYIFYNGSSGDISIYLLNSGTIGNVTIESVRVQNGMEPMFFDGVDIPDHDLGIGETVYLSLPCGALTTGNYFVSILTDRGSLFYAGFDVA
ncbi:MAG: hypothetical protein E3J73_00280 [Candidatus Bathyarchaeum sp.]|nr:MAG: hypothetical protein E3J73_00280 [Candidatus Bathyarchaeum sp.]